MKIRKKPIVVDAWKIDTIELRYHGDVLDWVHNEYAKNDSRLSVVSDGQKMVLRIRTLEGVMTANEGDVLVKGVDGELYAIKWEIFRKTYDIVDDDGVESANWDDGVEYDVSFPVPPEHVIKPPPSLVVESIKDMPDGSAVVRVDMDYETLKIFAKKGLYATLVDEANKIIEEHRDA